MTNLPINQIEQKPTIEPKKQQWKRTTFNFPEGKAWCYQKLEQLPEQGELRPLGYYCYNCKNELFFRWKGESWRDNEPFKFHKLLVKVLEKKADDWKTGRKTHTYYAFCCQCADYRKTRIMEKVKKWAKETRQEIENCDCVTFIENKKREATQAIANYNSMIKDCDWLTEQLEQIKELKHKNSENMKRIGKNSFIEKRLDDFIYQLRKRQASDRASRNKEENYLLTYNEWETERTRQMFPNQQLKEINKE